MTIQINYLDSGIGIELIASGVVTGEEIIKAHIEVYNKENLKKQKYQIIDRTLCTKYQVSAEEIEKIADIDNKASEENPNIMIAVVSPTSLQFGMSKMWQEYLKNDRFMTKIFKDRQSANTWIKTYLDCQLT
jgi:sulfate adenylyltransferase subunit 1 (EFTu-like GTPase family)